MKVAIEVVRHVVPSYSCADVVQKADDDVDDTIRTLLYSKHASFSKENDRGHSEIESAKLNKFNSDYRPEPLLPPGLSSAMAQRATPEN